MTETGAGKLEDRIQRLEDRLQRLELEQTAHREQLRTAFQRIEAMAGTIEKTNRAVERLSETISDTAAMTERIDERTENQARDIGWIKKAAFAAVGAILIWVIHAVLNGVLG